MQRWPASVEHFSVFHITLVKSSSNLWTQRNICYLKSQELIQSTVPAVMADADALWLCHDDTDEKKRGEERRIRICTLYKPFGE